MSYILTLTNGTKFGVIEENEILGDDTLSGIGLIGKLSPNYGETQSNNFLHLTENFANTLFPEIALRGQLCYKYNVETNEGSIYVCSNQYNAHTESTIFDDSIVEKYWIKLPTVKLDEKEPEVILAKNGDLWYNPKTKKLYVFDSDSSKWICVGPDDYLNTINETQVLESDSSPYATFTYNFDENKEFATTSYLVTAKVVGKEIFGEGTSYYGTETNTAGWIIKCLINSYAFNIGDETSVKREIVGHPTYEMIGKTDGADDWKAEMVIDNIDDYNLDINVYGKPKNAKTDKVKWVVNLEMIKVYEE